VLRDVSFKVKAGETLAIVGATGAGKSSIINLLNRFYELNKGSITVDGIDIKEYELGTLRSMIALFCRMSFIFGYHCQQY